MGSMQHAQAQSDTHLLRQQALQGHNQAMTALASMLVGQARHAKEGKSQPLLDEAERWASQAARNGHLDAIVWLGDFYLTTAPDAPVYHKAEIWLQQAAAKGAQNSQFLLARFYADDSSPLFEPVRARQHFEHALMLEEPPACLARARYYQRQSEFSEHYDTSALIADLECAADAGTEHTISWLISVYHQQDTLYGQIKAEFWQNRLAEIRADR